MEEVWKHIDGFETYQVSTRGRVRGPRSDDIKPFFSKGGYAIVSLYANRRTTKKLVHRLVAEAFVDNPSGSPNVDHINRDRADNRSENLRWVTTSENNLNTLHRTKEMFGLRWHARGAGYYEIRFTANGKEHSFGTARTLEEAKQKRDAALTSTGCIPS